MEHFAGCPACLHHCLWHCFNAAHDPLQHAGSIEQLSVPFAGACPARVHMKHMVRNLLIPS